MSPQRNLIGGVPSHEATKFRMAPTSIYEGQLFERCRLHESSEKKLWVDVYYVCDNQRVEWLHSLVTIDGRWNHEKL
jgi:hypothetical protein